MCFKSADPSSVRSGVRSCWIFGWLVHGARISTFLLILMVWSIGYRTFFLHPSPPMVEVCRSGIVVLEAVASAFVVAAVVAVVVIKVKVAIVVVVVGVVVEIVVMVVVVVVVVGVGLVGGVGSR